jgi:hypothetical protein
MSLILVACACWLHEQKRVRLLEALTERVFDLQHQIRALDRLAGSDEPFDREEFARSLAAVVAANDDEDLWEREQTLLERGADAGLERFRLRGWIGTQRDARFDEKYVVLPLDKRETPT